MDSNTTVNIWINGRFIDRPITGVERVAREFLNVIATRHLDADGVWTQGSRRYRFRLVAPKGGAAESPWANLPLVRRGLVGGHAWEQFDLPRITAGDWLLSLCNTGPVLKRRHVAYLHDAQPFAIPHNFSLPFRLWYRTMFRLLGRTAAGILTNSRFTRDELSHHVAFNPERMTVCYPGSEHADRDIPAEDPLQRLDLPDRPFVLAVSSANPNKNFAGILKALKILGPSAPPCVIVGRRDQRHFGSIELDPGKVVHAGYVSDEELLALYRRALCLVMPSHYEGFGLPPLEAMRSGCPAIVSDSSALREVAGAGGNLCDPTDPASIAAAIYGLEKDPNQHRRSVRYGLGRARQFSWQEGALLILRCLAQCDAKARAGLTTGLASPET